MTTGHVTTDDERRRDLLQVIALYDAMTPQDRYSEHYSHLTQGCPIEQDTNDGQHRLLPDGVGCPLCANDPSPFEAEGCI